MGSHEKKTILIVEDVEINRQILAQILGHQYNILTAANGLEAIKILKEKYISVDLIMLDIVMPVMDGFEFLEYAKNKAEFKDIPTVFVTSETYKENILKGYQRGICDIIAKPFDPDVILQRVNHVIALNESRGKRRCDSDSAHFPDARGKPRTALIIDDVEVNRVLVKTALGADYKTIMAENGRTALELLEIYKEDISVVLLDLIMPVMDGMEMVDRARRRGLLGRIPVIAITAEDSGINMNRIRELGICEVIRKPLDPVIVKNRVNNMIELFSG